MKNDIYKSIYRLKTLLNIINNSQQIERLLNELEDLRNYFKEQKYVSMANSIRKLAEGSCKILLKNLDLEKTLNKLIEDISKQRKQIDTNKSYELLIFIKYIESIAIHSNKSAHESIKKYSEYEIDIMLKNLNFLFQFLIKWFDYKIAENMEIQRRNPIKYKSLGNVYTKMIPIFPYKKNYELLSEQIKFDFDVKNIFQTKEFKKEYEIIENYMKNKHTIYNEAKPNLLDFDIKRNEENNKYYIYFKIGISSYKDFLVINRNLDFLQKNNNLLRNYIENIDNVHDLILMEDIPKSLGLSSILVTSDDYVIFQKRNKSEVASNMYHVSIAEGLSIYKSYIEFIEKPKNKKKNIINDKNIEQVVFRALKEELGLEKEDIEDIEILSIYFDEELMQPIFQTTVNINKSKIEIEKYKNENKGIDTACEIRNLIFIKNEEDEIIKYLYDSLKNGKWSTHAIINIISYLEYIGEYEEIIELINNLFKKKILFSLGKQEFLSTLSNKLKDKKSF